MQAALQWSGDEGGGGHWNGNGSRNGPGARPRVGGWQSDGVGRRRGHDEARGKPAHRQGFLVLAPPLGHLQAAETRENINNK